MSTGDKNKAQRKARYFKRLLELLDSYNKIVIVSADNVGSNQMQLIRHKLRGLAVILMGKNTMIRRAMRSVLAKHPSLEALLPHVKGNVGFVFTNSDLVPIRDKLMEIKVQAAAKAGAIAPVDVIVQPGLTGLEPTKTSFFQALSIQTKINKAVIEILNPVHLIKAGAKVNASQAALLQMLNMRPFQYGLQPLMVYDDGVVYPPSTLDITDDEILQKFRVGVQNMAALSIQVGYPTVASLPYALGSAYRDLLAIALATNFSFPQADKIKELLANPEALAAAMAAAAGPAADGSASAASADTKAEPAKEEKKAEEKKKDEEEDEVMGGGGLFGNDEDEDY
jgi:large subunit ribosomal protein LP0